MGKKPRSPFTSKESSGVSISLIRYRQAKRIALVRQEFRSKKRLSSPDRR